MMKARRHFAILDIIAGQRVGTQEELCDRLRERGFDVTQATVSRDVKELKLAKTPDGLGYHYSLPEGAAAKSPMDRMQRIFKDLVVSCDHSQNIIVIKTIAAGAQSVASVIDAYGSEQILGTVAGDDTIIVVVRSNLAVMEVINIFNGLINA